MEYTRVHQEIIRLEHKMCKYGGDVLGTELVHELKSLLKTASESDDIHNVVDRRCRNCEEIVPTIYTDICPSCYCDL